MPSIRAPGREANFLLREELREVTLCNAILTAQ
jgi:hypothetical protein